MLILSYNWHVCACDTSFLCRLENAEFCLLAEHRFCALLAVEASFKEDLLGRNITKPFLHKQRKKTWLQWRKRL
jgi:hypothetical protein